MAKFAKKVVLYTSLSYKPEFDPILSDLIEDQVLLVCSVGNDCELYHDILDELFVGDGSIERTHHLITTWHENEDVAEVVEFARQYSVDHPDNDRVQIVRI